VRGIKTKLARGGIGMLSPDLGGTGGTRQPGETITAEIRS